MFSDPIFLSRKLRTKTTVTNYIGAWSDGQRETMIKQSPYLFKIKTQKNWHCKTVKCCLAKKLWKWKRSQITKWKLQLCLNLVVWYFIWCFAELDLKVIRYLKRFSHLFLNISWALSKRYKLKDSGQRESIAWIIFLTWTYLRRYLKTKS